jgi:hypothetical protein
LDEVNRYLIRIRKENWKWKYSQALEP